MNSLKKKVYNTGLYSIQSCGQFFLGGEEGKICVFLLLRYRIAYDAVDQKYFGVVALKLPGTLECFIKRPDDYQGERSLFAQGPRP
ncbi:MAG: hypothetical protein L5656_01900 [Thermanaeromonas sp.]|uniref:hypothetical protein n=1 Tax=Thermanaeromonas sp. TaxID=2003697 RepID=UPI002438D203|nr:hypothetical protein [Thermanaeromonas sp.]MCG0277277.1 hypothetical protein [Thermanaeromonas sp.]